MYRVKIIKYKYFQPENKNPAEYNKDAAGLLNKFSELIAFSLLQPVRRLQQYLQLQYY